MKQRNIMFIVFLLISVFLFYKTEEGLTQSKPKLGGILNVGINTDVVQVDPHVNPSLNASIVMGHVFERLLYFGENMEFVPILAEKWEIAPDLKTYTFFLRKGKIFHNGRELVGDDVKYSIERIMDPKTKNARRSALESIERIEVVDKYTVRFHLKKPDADLLSTLGHTATLMCVVPREEVEKQGGVMMHPVGTGPYKFVEWKPDRYVLLERFPQYKQQPGPMNGFGGECIAYIDKIKFVPIPEDSVAEMALLNKEIDFLLFVPHEKVEKFQKEYSKRGLVIDNASGLSWYGIFFGCDKAFTKDVKFRRACAYAVDLKMVAEAATRGHATVNPSFVSSINQFYSPFHKKWYKKDVKKAKQLLEESAYKGEIISLITTKKYPLMYKNSVAVQSELMGAGINVKLEVVEWATMLQRMYSGNFQMISFGFGARPDPALAFREVAQAGFEEQYPRFKETRDKVAKTLDIETRKKLFEEAHSLVIEGVPALLLYNPNHFNAYWNYLKNFKVFPTNQPRFWGAWIDK